MDNRRVFNRSGLGTLTGLLHVIAGFFSSLWTAVTIMLIGWKEVFSLGYFWGIFNYISESASLLLWISGIGILRNKRWGKILAVAWSMLVIVRSIILYQVSFSRRGILSSAYELDSILKLYYAVLYLVLTGAGPVYRFLKKRGLLPETILPESWIAGITGLKNMAWKKK